MHKLSVLSVAAIFGAILAVPAHAEVGADSSAVGISNTQVYSRTDGPGVAHSSSYGVGVSFGSSTAIKHGDYSDYYQKRYSGRRHGEARRHSRSQPLEYGNVQTFGYGKTGGSTYTRSYEGGSAEAEANSVGIGDATGSVYVR